MMLKTGTPSVLTELQINRANLYFIKLGIFSNLIFENKLVGAAGGWELIILSALS